MAGESPQPDPGALDGPLRFAYGEDEDIDPMDGIEVPEEGYFEYDESWFDIDEL